MEKIIERLKEAKLKNTFKRKAVLEVFNSRQEFLNPLELREILEKKGVSVGIPSIYRILEELKKAGICKTIEREDRNLYYFLCFPSPNHHHHFFCNRCRKVIHINYCAMEKDVLKLKEIEGCTIKSHSFSIEGLCQNCSTIGVNK